MTTSELSPLLLLEQDNLRECETVIERGLATFVEVGTALARIRDGRLYRATHATFEDYCRERWGFSRNYANKQIAAAETVRAVEREMGTNVPIANEGQARAIAPILKEHGPEVAAEVLRQAASSGVLTAVGITEHGTLFTGRAHVSHNSGENEWYTPAHILEAARITLGDIDLDPASSDVANRAVKAARIFTAEDDGLAQEWFGRVWMNPPYAQPLIAQFVEKVCTSYRSGDIKAAIVLVNNGTETAWGQALLNSATAVCFPSSRIRFLRPDGMSGAPLQGQMIAYLGPYPETFTAAFSNIGAVL